ncbi:MAG: WecB/TagA/CpsF family glycosyltransferase [Rhizobiales bacterium]|nr:WecB/TagA/CpsF family glycosyltransferase [Hyphomicrobiales bacterium]
MPNGFDQAFRALPTVTIGGLPITVLDRDQTADWMIRAAREHPRGGRPLYLTSANGEVIARAAGDAEIAALILAADQIVADGQPMVTASRYLCSQPLPERVGTTDLFHDVARRAVETGVTFYMLGATEEENARAVAAARRLYPGLRIVGQCHGFLKGEALDAKLAEINGLAPDILWLAMGVPHEQRFVHNHAGKLGQVGLIKTSGGLFNFLSGTNRRAPGWMQAASLEWAYRVWLEPRRLFWRYAVTNPRAIYLMATRSA